VCSSDLPPLQVFRTRGGGLRAAWIIPERKNAPEGLGRRQNGVCSQVRGGKNASPELYGILRSWVNVCKDASEMPASFRRGDCGVQEKAECAELKISLHPRE